jgi:MoxR-like ATPase
LEIAGEAPGPQRLKDLFYMSQKAAPPAGEQNLGLRYQPTAAPVQEVRPSRAIGAELRATRETVTANSGWVRPLQEEIARVIVGQRHLLDRLVIALLTNGHVLLEGVPGLAKTLALKTLASCVALQFKRLQFTPDMLPADIVGTMIYSPQDGAFRTKHGPIFSNLILADEINRAPAKVQSALLEAMQEKQVTIGDQTYKLEEPFLVLATQNPIEQEGTYPLPEAQLDRFMFNIIVGYPNRAEELDIMDAMATTEAMAAPRAVVSAAQIVEARHVVNMLFIDDKVRDYIVDIVLATRPPIAAALQLNGFIQNGASPRATIALTLAARAMAFLNGRHFVTPQDVKTVAMDVLRHRVSVTYEAEAENVSSENVIEKILNTLPVP